MFLYLLTHFSAYSLIFSQVRARLPRFHRMLTQSKPLSFNMAPKEWGLKPLTRPTGSRNEHNHNSDSALPSWTPDLLSRRQRTDANPGKHPPAQGICLFFLHICHADENDKQRSTSAHRHVQKKTYLLPKSTLLQTNVCIENLFRLHAYTRSGTAGRSLHTGRKPRRLTSRQGTGTAKES